MVFSAYTFALIAVICGSLGDIIFRFSMKNDACPWASLLFYHIIALVILIPFLNIQMIFAVSEFEFSVLLLVGIIWLVADLFCVKALKYIDASTAKVYGTFELVLVALIGFIVFSESITFVMLLGMALIALSVIFQMSSASFVINKGSLYKGISIVFMTVALMIDKYLTSLVGEEVIVFYGFFLPLFIYVALGYRRLPQIVPAIKKSKYFLLASPVLGLVSYYCLIQAFSHGEFSVTATIQQTGIIFVFIFEVVLLKSYRDFKRKAFSSTVCAIGAMVVCGVI